MVKVGIINAANRIAGEIIRILINHPETELVSIYEPSLTGRAVSSIHHGLIGSVQLNFTDKLNYEDLDLIIITGTSHQIKNIKLPVADNLKIITLSEDYNYRIDENSIAALSEIHRKPLVREGKIAHVISPLAVPVLVALAPLASFLLLNSDIEVEISLPEDIAERIDTKKEISVISDLLKEKQVSFNRPIGLKIKPTSHLSRGTQLSISLSSSLPLEEIEKIYEQTYDDHNFSFLTSQDVEPKEVEGTQNVVFNIRKPDAETLNINVVTDSRMRGGAGDVVHTLNLLFGLHEKTGLHLKSSVY